MVEKFTGFWEKKRKTSLKKEKAEWCLAEEYLQFDKGNVDVWHRRRISVPRVGHVEVVIVRVQDEELGLNHLLSSVLDGGVVVAQDDLQGFIGVPLQAVGCRQDPEVADQGPSAEVEIRSVPTPQAGLPGELQGGGVLAVQDADLKGLVF